MKAKGPVLAEAIEGNVILDSIFKHNLLGGQKRVLVAVSGGQDSVCLLHILSNLREELKVDLHVAHLDHGLRGAESEADARYVARLAKRLGIAATIEKRDVKAFRSRHKLSLEEAAREVRYAFFADVADTIGTDRVAVAHTSDDHIETILMHLIRGSGLRGLRGLQPVNQWKSGDKSLTVIRPLLRVPRAGTSAYCRILHLRPRNDSSNLSLTPFRNKVRLELLPLLKKYNPRIAEALQRTSVQAVKTADFIEKECRSLWDRIVRHEDGAFVLDKRKFMGVPPMLQRSLVLMILDELQGNLDDIESRHIDEITAALVLPAGRSINLPGGFIFAVDYDKFLLTRGSAELCPLPPLEGEIRLKIPGKTRFSGWLVTAAINSEDQDCHVPSEPGFAMTGTGRTTIPAEAGIQKTGDFVAYLDFEKTGKELIVRPLKPGDTFQPLGMNQPKKVARFMVDARISRSWRDRVPIVASPDQIVWVAGWRIDERVKISESTRNALRLEFKRTE